MADKEKNDKEKKDEAPKPKSNLLLMVMMLVNMLGVAGVLVYMLLFQKSEAPAAAAAPPPVPAEVMPEGRFGPLVELNPIVANLADEDSTRYAKVTLNLEVANEEQAAEVEEMLVPIRDRMVLHLSGITASGTKGEEQKTVIKERLKEIANEVVGSNLIRNVYFGEFVVQ